MNRACLFEERERKNYYFKKQNWVTAWKDPNCATNWKKTKNVITIGTMFSGVESYAHALENTPIQHCFSIEHDPYCCKVIRNTLEPQHFGTTTVNSTGCNESKCRSSSSALS